MIFYPYFVMNHSFTVTLLLLAAELMATLVLPESTLCLVHQWTSFLLFSCLFALFWGVLSLWSDNYAHIQVIILCVALQNKCSTSLIDESLIDVGK